MTPRIRSVLRSALFLALLARLTAADSVLINYAGNDFRTGSNLGAPNGSLVLLLANVGTSTTAGAGFSTLAAGSLAVGSLLNGSYQVLHRTGIDASFGTSTASGGASLDLLSATFPNLSTGDQLAVAWFPTLDFTTGTSLLAGTTYGLYTLNASSVWQVPAVTQTLSINVPDGQLASLSAIPEPSTYAALFGLAMLGVAVLRRRLK